MKLFITTLLIALSANLYGQDLKTVRRDTAIYTEKFQVLKSDKNIRQGMYMLISNSSGRVLTTGFYKNNQRDSIWRDYDRQDHVVAEGRYANGKRTGEWNYYNERWIINDTYDYDKNQLLYHRPTKADSTTKYRILVGTDTLNILPERPPIYLGGFSNVYRSLASTVRYPAEARSKRITGKVLISFVVDENGQPRDYKIERPIGYGLDEEAIRAVKLIPAEWVPARYKGKAVASIIVIPLSFHLN